MTLIHSADDTKLRAREKIRVLIDKYAQVAADQKRYKHYNEEETKKKFIEPLFEALGWDLEIMDEVSLEENVSKGRVDYGFRINGIPKFFLEAKRLRENLDDVKFIKQTIDYSWNKACTWAVLTDFEGIKIFNAEVCSDDYYQHQFTEIKWTEFLDRFDDLWLLSKEAFELGLLDKVAEKWGKKFRRIHVDKQLLDDFTLFREILSTNITRLNKGKNLTKEELDEAVQRMLDRLIFIRYCEDKELEERQLISNIRVSETKGRVIRHIRELFSYYRRYNSSLFRQHLCDELEIDNEILHEIIEGLYYTKDGPFTYDFSAIEADCLGNIYEQYLGHILKKTEKNARLTASAAKRKQKGIYYTPSYVVDYIVRNTVGKLLEDNKVNPEKIRILDPACGSGSFLIKAFDVLNDYYINREKDYAQTRLDMGGQDVAYAKKLGMFQNNIFGVDLDKQAIEITELRIFLKVARRGRKLPQLQENIKQGNSLIDDPKIAGDKAFNWEQEFSEIMKKDGRFNVIIGNPPYEVLIKSQTDSGLLEYLKEEHRNNYTLEGEQPRRGYWSAEYNPNLFVLFIERSLELLRDGGLLGFIIQNSLFSNVYFKNIRRLILERCLVKEIIDFRFGVFKEAVVDSTIIILQKENDKSKRDRSKVKVHLNITSIDDISNPNKLVIFEQSFFNDPNTDYRFPIYLEPTTLNIIKKLNKLKERMGEFVFINRGIGLVSPDDRHKASLFKDHKSSDTDKPVFIGKNVRRYVTRWSGKWAHIDDTTIVGGTRDPNVHEAPEKIVLPRIRNLKYKQRILASFDNKKIWALDNYNILRIRDKKISLKFVLGLLNSKLLNFYFGNVFIDVNIKGSFIEKLPIVIQVNQEQIISFVDKMLSLNKRLDEIGDKLTDERTKIEEEINKIDAKINELVYKIYGITEDEKKVIEDSLESLTSTEPM